MREIQFKIDLLENSYKFNWKTKPKNSTESVKNQLKLNGSWKLYLKFIETTKSTQRNTLTRQSLLDNSRKLQQIYDTWIFSFPLYFMKFSFKNLVDCIIFLNQYLNKKTANYIV